MATSLVSTGVQFPDSTIQTTAATAGGSITATASGALTAGAPVVVNSNGTVSVVAATYSGTWTVNTSASNATGLTGNLQMSATYDPNANAVVLWYGNSSGYPTVLVGMISGTTITWGTPTVIYSSGTVTGSTASKSIYASTANAHMYFQNGSDGYWRYSSVRISSTGAITTIQSISSIDYFPAPANNYRVSFLYDPSTNRLALFAPSTADNYSRLIGGYCDTSGYFYYAYSSIVDAGGTTPGPCAAYMDNGVGVLFWQNDSYYLWTRTATLSNSSASLGTTVLVGNWNNNNYSITVGPQASGSGNLLYAYIPNGGSAMQFRAATRSGTTITLGSTSVASNYGYFGYYYSQFLTYGGRTIWVNDALAYNVTVSGGVPLGTNIGVNSSRYGEPQNFIVNTADLNLLQLSYFNSTITQPSFYSDLSANITSTNFIGFSSAAYSNGQTATINVVSSTDNNQSGLTAGLKYYVTVGGTLSSSATSQPYAGVALSATKILVKG